MKTNTVSPATLYFPLIVLVSILFGMSFLLPSTILAQEKTLRFVTLAWEPYYGPNLANEGYFTDIVREAFKQVGYRIKIDYVPWKRALYEAENLYYDGLLGIYYTEDRAEWLYYSEPVSEAEIVLFARKGSGIDWQRLEDLQQYTIGIENGYAYGDAFDSATFLKKDSVRKLELNVKKLLEGRIDLMAAARKRVFYWMSQNSPDKKDLIEVVGKPIKSNTLYIAFPVRTAESMKYLNAFDRGLRLIRENNTYSKILIKNGVESNDAQ